MKPIKLKMSAFGPYADVETVDFSAFDGKGLFLIAFQPCIVIGSQQQLHLLQECLW